MDKEFDGKTILLIDDDESTHILINAYLRNTTATILSAKNGEEGISQYISNKVDLVILDINMPKMNGYETLKKLKKINPDIDVIMCTSDYDAHQKVYDLGAIAYVVKPINREKLLKIAEVLFKLQIAV